MRYLVLGSSGSIGQNLSKYLKSKGNQVLDFDIKNAVDEDLRISPNTKLNQYIKEVDFIYFLAFDVGGAEYLRLFENDFNFILNNTKIMINTFEVIKRYNKKFIFISSYMANNPRSSYSILKKIGEKFSISLNGLVVRLYNVYCNEQIGIKSHVIPDMIYQANLNKKIVLNTDGKEERQFLHIDDCCRGLYILSENYQEILRTNSIVDLSSFEWVSIENLAILISSIFDCELEFSNKKASFCFKSKPNKHILKYWSPELTLIEGVNKLLTK